MCRLLSIVVLLYVTGVFTGEPGCLQREVNNARGGGFSVLALNFQKEDVFLNTEVGGTSKEIKFESQKLYDGSKLKCTVIPDRENRVKLFGKKYMVFAGVYKENGVYPRLSNDFQKARCLDGWEFEENKGKLCDRLEFQFVPQSRSCVNDETFFIQARIDIPQCANHIFESLHSKGLIGRLFFSRSAWKHDDVDSPHNDPNIQLIGWEQWTEEDKQDLGQSKCQSLQYQNKKNLAECHLLKLRVYGKPYLVLYWVFYYYNFFNMVVSHDHTMMQCQAGLEFNSTRFFPCHEDPENGLFVDATPAENECSANYPMIGVGALRQ